MNVTIVDFVDSGRRPLGDHVEITWPPHARGVEPPASALSFLALR
jgi:hypothetical protein